MNEIYKKITNLMIFALLLSINQNFKPMTSQIEAETKSSFWQKNKKQILITAGILLGTGAIVGGAAYYLKNKKPSTQPNTQPQNPKPTTPPKQGNSSNQGEALLKEVIKDHQIRTYGKDSKNISDFDNTFEHLNESRKFELLNNMESMLGNPKIEKDYKENKVKPAISYLKQVLVSEFLDQYSTAFPDKKLPSSKEESSDAFEKMKEAIAKDTEPHSMSDEISYQERMRNLEKAEEVIHSNPKILSDILLTKSKIKSLEPNPQEEKQNNNKGNAVTEIGLNEDLAEVAKYYGCPNPKDKFKVQLIDLTKKPSEKGKDPQPDKMKVISLPEETHDAEVENPNALSSYIYEVPNDEPKIKEEDAYDKVYVEFGLRRDDLNKLKLEFATKYRANNPSDPDNNKLFSIGGDQTILEKLKSKYSTMTDNNKEHYKPLLKFFEFKFEKK